VIPLQKAGVKYFRFHPLRHAGASFMENIGVPISHIQEILGHESRKTTEGYIHSLRNNKQQAIQKYEKERESINETDRYQEMSVAYFLCKSTIKTIPLHYRYLHRKTKLL
jgi:hypothetical protein